MPEALRAMLLEKLAPQYEYLRPIFPELVEDWLNTHKSQIQLTHY